MDFQELHTRMRQHVSQGNGTSSTDKDSHHLTALVSKSWWLRVKENVSEESSHFLKHPKHLQDYLMDGYEKYLPLEMSCGGQDSSEILEDYMDKKVYIEESSNY